MSMHPRVVKVVDDAVPIAHVNLAFEASPAFDPPGREGLACITNRLLCRGTQHLDHPTLSARIESLGTELLTSTQTSLVTLGGTVLARNLNAFLELLGDIVTQPALLSEELERVRRELLAEHGVLLDNDSHLGRHWLRRHMFAESSRGNAPIGRKSSVASITMDDVIQWHRANYVQERMVIGVSGAVDGSHQRDALSALVARVPSGNRGMAHERRFKAERSPSSLVDKPDRSQSQIIIGHPLCRIEDRDEFRLRLWTSSFGGTFTSRLMQVIRVKRGLSYGAYAWMNHERVCSHYLLGANCDAEKTVDTLEILLDQYQELFEVGQTEEEIQFAQQSLRNGFPFTMETASQEAANRLRATLNGRESGALERYRDFLHAEVSGSMIHEAVKQHLTPDHLSIVIVGTAQKALMQRLEQLQGVNAVDVVAYDAHLLD